MNTPAPISAAEQTSSILPQHLLRILICPDCGGPLNEVSSTLLGCPECKRACPITEDGIVQMLPMWMSQAESAKEKIEAEAQSTTGESRTKHVVEYESAFHDEQARIYDDLFTSPEPLRTYYEYLIRNEVSREVKEAGFVVDLCCGTGKSSLPLAVNGKVVVGVDVSNEMLKIFAKKCRKLGVKALLLHADASRPPIRSGTCEAILFIGGLHHIPDQEACIAYVAQLLTSGGKLIIHEPLSTHRKSVSGRIADNLYALMDFGRVARAIRRRLGLSLKHSTAVAEEPFTPFEQPFSSLKDVRDLFGSFLSPVVIRGQAFLSLRELPPGARFLGPRVLSRVLVVLDLWASKNGFVDWRGSAVFAVGNRK